MASSTAPVKLAVGQTECGDSAARLGVASKPSLTRVLGHDAGGREMSPNEDVPVLRYSGRLEICCVSHAGNSSGREVARADTASSLGLSMNEVDVERAFSGSSE